MSIYSELPVLAPQIEWDAIEQVLPREGSGGKVRDIKDIPGDRFVVRSGADADFHRSHPKTVSWENGAHATFARDSAWKLEPEYLFVLPGQLVRRVKAQDILKSLPAASAYEPFNLGDLMRL